jgi:hypothetical protein
MDTVEDTVAPRDPRVIMAQRPATGVEEGPAFWSGACRNDLGLLRINRVPCQALGDLTRIRTHGAAFNR